MQLCANLLPTCYDYFMLDAILAPYIQLHGASSGFL